MDKNKVCISFAEIYKAKGAYLQYGGYIDFYDDGESEYYDLRTNEPGALLDSHLLACDGEEFEIVQKMDSCYILRNNNNDIEFYLSAEEYSIGVFQ